MVCSVGNFYSLKEECLIGDVAMSDGCDTCASHIFNLLVADHNMCLCSVQEETI